MKHPRIVFFGTPEFAVPALEALVSAGYEVVAVVTQPDKPVGRGLKMEAPAVKVKALELGLTVLQPKTLKDSPSQPQRTVLEQADLGACVAYGKIIPKSVLDIFPHGILNIHPSHLPKYRGPSPIQAAILNGDTETGVTIMLLDAEMDHGPVLARSTYHVTRNTTGGALSAELAQLGAKLFIETLPKWLSGEIKPQPQEHAKATFTKLLEREDGKIDWNKSMEYIERMVRAYDLWPGTWTMYQNQRLKVLTVALSHPPSGDASNSAPGYVWKTPDTQLAVNCNPGSIILENIQLEGKKAITGAEFMRGHPAAVGACLV